MTEQKTENLLKFKLVSCMTKVLPWQEPSEDGVLPALSGLRGETVSFQIAYRWDGLRKSRGKIEYEIQNLNGVSVRVRTVGLSPCAYPCHPQRDDDYLADRPGMYPDLLQDLRGNEFPLIAGQWRSLWIDLEIGEDAGEGIGTVAFSISGKENSEKENFLPFGNLPLDLKVIGARLPELKIPHTEWFHSDCLANYYGVEVFSERHWVIIENFVRTAVRRGCNTLLTPLFTPPLDTAFGGERRTVQLVDVKEIAPGEYSFSFDKLRRWVEMARRCGIVWFEMSHLFSQWGAKYAPKIVGERDGHMQQLFGWDTDAAGEAYRQFLHAFLDALLAELDRLGIREHTLFHLSDEPGENDFSSYAAARDAVKKKLKGCRLIETLSSYDFYEKGLIREPICGTDHLEPFLEEGRRPDKLWAYYCTVQCVDVSNRFIAMPGYRTRILGMQLYKYAIDGFLQWGYNFYNSEYSLFPVDPYACTDADGAFPSGDSFLVYPGPDGQPEESIRLMLMDEAMADLRAMDYLETLTDRQTVLDCLEEEHFGSLTFRSFPRSASYLANVRERVNEAICRALETQSDETID